MTEPLRLLLRHADAGDRQAWTGPDGRRVLSDLGRVQAQQLVARLGGLPIRRVLSSPAARCLQTVGPLARALGLKVETSPLVRIGGDPVVLARYLRRADTRGTLVCTHRETVLALFAQYACAGLRYIDGITHMPMAASWALYGGETGLPRVRYLRPDMRYRGSPERREPSIA